MIAGAGFFDKLTLWIFPESFFAFGRQECRSALFVGLFALLLFQQKQGGLFGQHPAGIGLGRQLEGQLGQPFGHVLTGQGRHIGLGGLGNRLQSDALLIHKLVEDRGQAGMGRDPVVQMGQHRDGQHLL